MTVDLDAPAMDLPVPAFDARALVRRAVLPAAVAVAAVAVILLAGGPLQAFADALRRALEADPRWVLAAAAFEVVSFSGYIALLWLVGERASPRLDLRATAQVTLGGAAVTRLLPTGGAGGVALTLWALRRTGMESRDATRTLLSFLVLLYSVFLVAIAVAGTLIAVGLAGSPGHVVLAAIPAAGAAAGLALALFAAARRPAAAPLHDGASRPARARAAAVNAAGTLGHGVHDALGHIRSGDARLLGAPIWWAFDAAVLYAMLDAFGTPPAVAIVVLGYFVGMVANTIPLPGAVSGGMVGILLAFGVEADLALASVLAYRALAIWLPAPVGLAALGGLRRTVARWAREDALPPQPQPQPLPALQPQPRTPRPASTWTPCPEPAVAV